MKKSIKLLASLILGLLVASCQNGLEEVLEQNAVLDELAITRAGEDDELSLPSAINLGISGSPTRTSSVRVVRASDGVEVYPSSIGLRPYTFYYAYLTSSQGTNMILTWEFNHATVYSSYGNLAYFQTDSYGYTFLTVKGRMPNSSTDIILIDDITLYGGSDSNAFTGDEILLIEEEDE